MTESPLVAKRSGYADDVSFDNFDVVAEPCRTRESRIFRHAGGGTDYGSHSLKLATRKLDNPEKPPMRHDYYILLEHGGGRRVIALPRFYDGGEFDAALQAMPERVQYAALYTIARMVEDADHYARRDTAREYSAAFVEGRLRKSRSKQGKRYVTIEAAPTHTAMTAV